MQKTFNPEMLTLARGAAGISQSKFAKMLDWSQGKVSKIEHSLLVVREDEVGKIADCLNYPMAFFYQDDQALGFGTCCTYNRKKRSAPIRKLNQLHDEINIRRMQIARLLKGVELPYESSFPSLDIDEYGCPEEVARLLRSVWQLPKGPIRNLVNLVEQAGGIVMLNEFPLHNIDGVSQRVEGLPNFFFLDRSKSVDRIRFTLAHEIGHLVMHGIPTPDAEKEADCFAAAFLMPAKEIMPDLKGLTLPKAAQLKLKWRASMQSIIYRAKSLGAITEAKYRSLFVRLSQLGYRKNEPNPLEKESPKVLREVIDHYLNEKGYSIGDLSKVALMNEESFTQEFLEEKPRLRVV